MNNKILCVDLDDNCEAYIYKPAEGLDEDVEMITGYEAESVTKYLNTVISAYEDSGYEIVSMSPVTSGSCFVNGQKERVKDGFLKKKMCYTTGVGAGFSYTSGYTLHFRKVK
jgi:hypothetical protein